MRAVLTAVRMASPSAPPTCCPALRSALATPASSGGTPATAELVSDTKVMPMPSASTQSAGRMTVA